MELLVTLAIVAIVAGFALPSIQQVLGGSQISASSNQLVYSLQSARSEAIKRVTPVILCPSEAPLADKPVCGGNYTSGWIVFADVDTDGKNSDADVLVLQSEALSAAFSIVPDNRFSKAVVFGIAGSTINATGGPASGDIVIRHSGSDEKRTIRIAASGRISTVLSASTSTGTSTASGATS